MKKIHLGVMLLAATCLHSQTPYTINSSGSTNLSSGGTQLNANYINIGASNYQVSNNAQLDAKARYKVTAQDGFQASAFSATGFAHLHIDTSMLDVVSYHANGFSGIPKYDRFELGIKLPSDIQARINTFLSTYSGSLPLQSLNPYDPDMVKVECQITKPDNSGFLRFGFYYQPYSVSGNAYVAGSTDHPFRIRIAPPDTGVYSCNINVYINNVLACAYPNIHFSVVNSTNPGHLVLAPASFRKMRFENNDPFFGIGQNIPGGFSSYPWPSDTNANHYNPSFNYVVDTFRTDLHKSKVSPFFQNEFRGFVEDLGKKKGNLVRMRLDPWSVPIEHADFRTGVSNNYSLERCITNFHHNQMFLWEFDSTLALCEDPAKRVYIMLNLFNDGLTHQYGAGGLTRWTDFPYSHLIGSTANANAIDSLFLSPVARALYKKQLYYIHARWGYSTSIAMWEFINETENTNHYPKVNMVDPDPNLPNHISSWICDMSSYLGTLSPKHLTTDGTTAEGFLDNNLLGGNCLDVYSANYYRDEVDANVHNNFKDDVHGVGSHYFNTGYPYIHGELGMGVCVSGKDTAGTAHASHVEKFNDRSFHNYLWSTAVSGNVATGMNWADQEQLFVDHRQNYKALRNFTDNVDWYQVLIPQRYAANAKNRTTGMGPLNVPPYGIVDYSNHKLSNLYMMNSAGNYVVGWSMMDNSFWAYDSAFTPFPNYDELLRCAGYTNKSSIVDYDITGNHMGFSAQTFLYREPMIEIRGMEHANHTYRVEFFDTYGNPSGSLNSANYTSDGSYVLRFPKVFLNHLSSGLGPDIAYIIHDDVGSRMANSGSAAEDKTAGVSMSAKLAEQGVQVFPNPANDFINLLYDEAYFTDAVITVLDITGKTVKQAGNAKLLYTGDLEQGLYLVTFKNNQFEKSFKLSIAR